MIQTFRLIALSALCLACFQEGSAQVNSNQSEPTARVEIGRFQTTFRLLRTDAVQSESRLTDDQIKSIKILHQNSRMASTSNSMRLNTQIREAADDEARKKAMSEIVANRFQMESTALEDVSKILSDDQMTRLKQLVFQNMGVEALGMKEIQAELALNDEQIGKMSDLVDAYRLMNPLNHSPEEVQNGRSEIERQAMSNLTDEQKAKWKKLLGQE